MSTKYDQRVKVTNSLLCVGLDSDIEQLPERFAQMEKPQFAFNTFVIEETHQYVSAYKLNTAFYESRGDVGIQELKETFEYLQTHHPDIYTILDAKRADIGNTNRGTATFAFDWLGADAITVHPYLGREALSPFLSRADKGVIVLCRTSNPGAPEFQDLRIDGMPLWQWVATRVAEDWNEKRNCMLVVGATYPEELKQVRACAPSVPILVPGIGAQGGDVEAVLKAGCDARGRGLIVSASRSIIFAAKPGDAARLLMDEMNSYRR